MIRSIPSFFLSEPLIQGGQQLAHTGHQCDFSWFSGFNQPCIKRFNNRIETDCYKCGDVQRGSHSRPVTKEGSSVSHVARIAVNRSNIHEGTYFPSRKSPSSGTATAMRLATLSLRELFKVDTDMVTSSSSSVMMMILIFFCFDGGWVQLVTISIVINFKHQYPYRIDLADAELPILANTLWSTDNCSGFR